MVVLPVALPSYNVDVSVQHERSVLAAFLLHGGARGPAVGLGVEAFHRLEPSEADSARPRWQCPT